MVLFGRALGPFSRRAKPPNKLLAKIYSLYILYKEKPFSAKRAKRDLALGSAKFGFWFF
jgi:hypothetical protein